MQEREVALHFRHVELASWYVRKKSGCGGWSGCGYHACCSWCERMDEVSQASRYVIDFATVARHALNSETYAQALAASKRYRPWWTYLRLHELLQFDAWASSVPIAHFVDRDDRKFLRGLEFWSGVANTVVITIEVVGFYFAIITWEATTVAGDNATHVSG